MSYQSRDDIKKKLENPPPDMHRLVTVVNETQRVVGILGLQLNNRHRTHVGSFRMSVHDDYQNQGIGTMLMEAILDLADNEPAIHMYEKYGFVIEGTHKYCAIQDGVYIDAYSMTRLKT